MGWLEELSSSIESWGYKHLQNELPPEFSIDDLKLRSYVLREGRMPKRNPKDSINLIKNNSIERKRLQLDDQQLFIGHRRLVEEILDNYDPTVHPRKDFRESTRVNLSMSLYQILEVDERRQSIVVNVWMVQNWFDEFLDWNPNKFEMINKTIVPYQQIWVPDTVLYNSEEMDRRSTEALMNAIVETGYWRNDSKGASVQLMFPAIYKLSCKMNVKFFPYDQQNCSFIISSWTHDSSTINYHFERPNVNLLNFASNDEWTVISFNFQRIEQQFKCCKNPWTMLYAHLVIRRKPLYYIVNLVIPTSIITIVSVTGFFTPSSSSNERDEKLYLGINTLMTMMLMLLMVTNQMPNTSNYVPLMSWYYMGIIGTCVFGTLIATFVLFLHSRKSLMQLPPLFIIKNFLLQRWIWRFILEPPSDLKEIWAEYGLIKLDDDDDDERKEDVQKLKDPLHQQDEEQQFILPKAKPLSHESFSHTRQLVSATRQIAQSASRTVGKERRRRETIDEAADFLSKGVFGHRKAEFHRLQRNIRSGSRIWIAGGGRSSLRFMKRQKMMRRCSMEWEYLANCIDRCLLAIFGFMTTFFFSLLAFYERWIELGSNFGIN